MSNSIVLHIGPHKTGTTAIQKKLESGVLKNTGFTYMEFFSDGSSLHQYADNLSQNKSDLDEMFLQSIDGLESNIVISTENFSRLNSSQVEKLYENLKNKRVKIVYYLRNPLVRLYSLWKEKIKHGYEYTLSDYMCSKLVRPFIDEEFNDVRRIGYWVNCFGKENVFLISYEDGAKSVTNFLNHALNLGFIYDSEPASNRSFDIDMTEGMRVLLGYQRQIRSNKEVYEKFTGMVRGIRNSRFRKVEHISYEKSNSAITAIENNIYSEFRESIIPKCQSRFRYGEKGGRLKYINPNIWLKDNDLCDKRLEIFDHFERIGMKVSVDKRLKDI